MAKFVEGSTLKHIAVMTSTAAIGLMAVCVVDLFFLSLLGETELAAAVGFAGVILFFTRSICIGQALRRPCRAGRADYSPFRWRSGSGSSPRTS